jgi:hypothetical protein
LVDTALPIFVPHCRSRSGEARRVIPRAEVRADVLGIQETRTALDLKPRLDSLA